MMKANRKILPVGLFVVVASVILLPVLTLISAFNIFLSDSRSLHLIEGIIGFTILILTALLLLDIFFLAPVRKHNNDGVLDEPTINQEVTVALTAYNDELSIAIAVEDFLNHPNVKRVIVVNNNSSDATGERAANAGALVIFEPDQGYGHCVFRALQEASSYLDTELVVLCEGDMTFRAKDINKLLAFESHGQIINGTRISEQLRMPDTQLSNFIYFGNFFVGKLLELKHLGKGTLTDVGTTYKLCKSKYLRENLIHYNPEVNFEFNAYFLDKSLQLGARVVEVPVTFHKRIGISKGGNISNKVATRVGLKMIRGIVFGWPEK
jgi:glycosyltransferase involved in cell wall biosynthesis